MDERQQNNLKAVAASSVALALIVMFAQIVLIPIYEHQREATITKNCPNGLENCNLIIEPSFLWVLLGMPAIFVYIITYKHLEYKRLKTWKTWK